MVDDWMGIIDRLPSPKPSIAVIACMHCHEPRVNLQTKFSGTSENNHTVVNGVKNLPKNS